ncbi:MAG: hypothetical protein LBG82_01205 [Clostridiales Family XIII bacterium]|jgi:alpha-mannosidase|nr:hypothetical protein [Clostridiales Family XIII bacterium]
MENYRLWIEYADDIIKKISSAGLPGICTFFQGDIRGCEMPDYDDSGWENVIGKGAPINGINVNSGTANDHSENLKPCDWSMVDGPAAMRKRIALPEYIEGIPTEGTKIYITMTMLAPLDIHIDGKHVASYKYWGDSRPCEITVTPRYKRGATHTVVFKTPQGEGDAHLGVYINCEVLEQRMLELSTAITQLRFAQKLADFGFPQICEALSEMNDALHSEAVHNRDWEIIKTDLAAIDTILEKIDCAAKQFKVHLIAHSHIDMNWLWNYDETKDICVRDFRTIVKLMDENPDLCFSQSQSCVYDIVQQNDPETFSRVLEKIAEGSWEVTAATWSEHDLYTSSGETFIQQLLQASRYSQNVLHAPPSRVCWEPDTFGHPATVPNLLTKAGVSYYYHFRCNAEGHALKWWEGTDGSRLLDYCFGPYNNALRPENVISAANEFLDSFGVHTSMFVFGVGDHGGGPTRRDISIKRYLDSKPGLPKLVFSKVCAFFDEVLAEKQDWPIYKGEQGFIFEGCYTTKAAIKKMQRDGDARLCDAQAAAALNMLNGNDTTEESQLLNESWRKICFNGFHDIACGCNIHAADSYNFQIGGEAIASADKVLQKSLRIDGNDGITVFNSLAFERTDIVSAPLPPNSPESIALRWDGGTSIGQISGNRVMFVADNMQGLSSRHYSLEALDTPPCPMPLALGSCHDDGSVHSLRSKRYLLEISARTGTIVTLRDEISGRDVLEHMTGFAEVPSAFNAQRSSGILKMIYEEPHIMSAWVLGNEMSLHYLIDSPEVKVTQNGPVLSQIRITRKYNASTFTEDITLYDDLARVDIHFNLDWNELGHHKTGIPVLRLGFSTAVNNPKYIYETPMGSISREKQATELPSLRYVALAGENMSVALFNDNKHGFRVAGPQIDMTLVRGSYSPDAAPDRREVSGRCAIQPYYGTLSLSSVQRDAMSVNCPLVAVEGNCALWDYGIRMESDHVLITSIKPSHDGKQIAITAMETSGAPANAALLLPASVDGITESDILQNPLRPLSRMECSDICFRGNEIKSFLLSIRN